MTRTLPEPGVAAPAPGHRAQHAQVAEGVQVRPEQPATGGQYPPDVGDPGRVPVQGEMKRAGYRLGTNLGLSPRVSQV